MAQEITSQSSSETIDDKYSKEDLIDELNADDTEEDVVEEKVEEKEEEIKIEEPEEEEEKIELAEDDEEEEKTVDEELEEIELMTPVRRKEILKKYPGIFKDFPYLEKAYYREQQYTEILPTIDDAKLAVDKAGSLDRFENHLMQGSTEEILKVVKESNGEAFNKIVDNYLPALHKTDPQAYFHVLGNVTKNTIIAMLQESDRLKNDTLKESAQVLNQFVFGTSELTAPQQLAKEEKNPEADELKQEKEQFLQERFENARDNLQTKVDNALKATIDRNIDPRNTMTDYVKRNAIRDALENLTSLISQDERFTRVNDNLWRKAFDEKFSQKSTDRIKSAYLSKAKTVLADVIKRSRNDALKGMGKRVEKDRQGPVKGGRATSSSTTTKPGEIPAGMKTIDFFNME